MCDKIIGEVADNLEPKSYTSREFIYELGQYLKKNSKKKDSLIEWPVHRRFLTKIRFYLINILLNINYDSSGAYRCFFTKKN